MFCRLWGRKGREISHQDIDSIYNQSQVLNLPYAMQKNVKYNTQVIHLTLPYKPWMCDCLRSKLCTSYYQCHKPGVGNTSLQGWPTVLVFRIPIILHRCFKLVSGWVFKTKGKFKKQPVGPWGLELHTPVLNPGPIKGSSGPLILLPLPNL